MNLLNSIRSLRDTETTVAVHPMAGGLVDPLGMTPVMDGALTIAGLEDQIAKLISDASDEDLLDAYEHTSGALGDADANAILAQIEARGLDI